MSVDSGKPVIKMQGVWKNYLPGGNDDAAALRGVDFVLMPGQSVALFGTSGSGKTTLLNLLAGLDLPGRGTIEIEGRDLRAIGEGGRTILRRRRLGFVFQFFNLLPTLTVYENVLLSLELAGRPSRRKVLSALSDVGLNGLEERFPYQISGGEQQRVAVARALVKDPAVILADEPTGNLDTAVGNSVLELLAGRCRDSSTALLMATHAERTVRYADRVLRILDGRVTEDPPPGVPRAPR